MVKCSVCQSWRSYWSRRSGDEGLWNLSRSYLLLLLNPPAKMGNWKLSSIGGIRFTFLNVGCWLHVYINLIMYIRVIESYWSFIEHLGSSLLNICSVNQRSSLKRSHFCVKVRSTYHFYYAGGASVAQLLSAVNWRIETEAPRQCLRGEFKSSPCWFALLPYVERSDSSLCIVLGFPVFLYQPLLSTIVFLTNFHNILISKQFKISLCHFSCLLLASSLYLTEWVLGF